MPLCSNRGMIWVRYLALMLLIGGYGDAQTANVDMEVASVYPQAEALYRDLHEHPELSGHEDQTAAILANGLRQIGFDVTAGVGGTGVVGIFKNGPGKVALLRTELDALPVTGETGLPYASKVRATDASGKQMGVMHACGHDVHMAAWLSTARIMANNRSRWSGTLILIAQPAEETGSGAKAMIDDGLLSRFPRPDYAIAVHDDTRLPSGAI